MYYLRTRPKADAIQFTVTKPAAAVTPAVSPAVTETAPVACKWRYDDRVWQHET